jgi:hypothetical protein
MERTLLKHKDDGYYYPLDDFFGLNGNNHSPWLEKKLSNLKPKFSYRQMSSILSEMISDYVSHSKVYLCIKNNHNNSKNIVQSLRNDIEGDLTTNP